MEACQTQIYVKSNYVNHPQTRVLLFQFSIPPTTSLVSLSYVQTSYILLIVQILFAKELISVNNSICQPLDRGQSVIVAIVIVQMHQRRYHFEGILSQNFSMFAFVCNFIFCFLFVSHAIGYSTFTLCLQKETMYSVGLGQSNTQEALHPKLKIQCWSFS